MNTYNCTIVRTGYRLLSIEGWTLILTYLGQASSIQVTLAVHWCWNAIWNTGWSVRLFAYSNFSTIDVHPKKIFINRGPLQMSWPWNPVAPWSMKERKRKNDILKNLAFCSADIFFARYYPAVDLCQSEKDGDTETKRQVRIFIPYIPPKLNLNSQIYMAYLDPQWLVWLSNRPSKLRTIPTITNAVVPIITNTRVLQHHHHNNG